MKVTRILGVFVATLGLASVYGQGAVAIKKASNYASFTKAFKLDAQHLALLNKNKFVVAPSSDITLYYAYGSNDYLNVPSLLTADNLLQTYHIFFDSTLRTIEEKKLLPDIRNLTDKMLKASAARSESVKGTELQKASDLEIAYFAVADRLLGQSGKVPAHLEELVSKELALVEGAAGFDRSAIFPYEVDYSQFIVRGHYTKSDELKKYFKAMMWFGLVPVSVAARKGDEFIPLPDQIRMASLIATDLQKTPGAVAIWDRIYHVTSIFVGKANRLTPKEWTNVLNKAQAGWTEETLANDAFLQKVANAASEFRVPKIITKKDDAEVADDIQLRFMGQREIADSVIFNRVTYADMRDFPSPLDILAVFGSNRAVQILDSMPKYSNPKGWAEYPTIRAEVRREFAALPPAQWTENLYWSWLDLLRKKIGSPDAKAPAFMKSTAWTDLQLSSALAFWAELRHDTILYGEQTVAEMGDGDEEQPYVKGYVEPAVPVYEGLLAMINQTSSSLKKLGYLSSSQLEEFNEFHELTTFFLKCSKRQLAGQPLSKSDHMRIRKLEGQLESLNTQIQIIGTNYDQLTQNDIDMAQVADVHTANGQALTVAVGHADDLVALVPIEGKNYLARGTVFSYYEFKVPISGRLTDDEWKKRLETGPQPGRPEWIKSFFVNKTIRREDQ